MAGWSFDDRYLHQSIHFVADVRFSGFYHRRPAILQLVDHDDDPAVVAAAIAAAVVVVAAVSALAVAVVVAAAVRFADVVEVHVLVGVAVGAIPAAVEAEAVAVVVAAHVDFSQFQEWFRRPTNH